jgi:hypothetical protein
MQFWRINVTSAQLLLLQSDEAVHAVSERLHVNDAVSRWGWLWLAAPGDRGFNERGRFAALTLSRGTPHIRAGVCGCENNLAIALVTGSIRVLFAACILHPSRQSARAELISETHTRRQREWVSVLFGALNYPFSLSIDLSALSRICFQSRTESKAAAEFCSRARVRQTGLFVLAIPH